MVGSIEVLRGLYEGFHFKISVTDIREVLEGLSKRLEGFLSGPNRGVYMGWVGALGEWGLRKAGYGEG